MLGPTRTISPARRARGADGAAHRLGDDVERGPVGVWAGAGAGSPKPRIAPYTRRGIALVQRLVRKAEAVHHTDAEVLHQHVGAVDEREQTFAVGRLLQVEHDAALVAVDAGEVAAVGLLGVAPSERTAEAR